MFLSLDMHWVPGVCCDAATCVAPCVLDVMLNLEIKLETHHHYRYFAKHRSPRCHDNHHHVWTSRFHELQYTHANCTKTLLLCNCKNYKNTVQSTHCMLPMVHHVHRAWLPDDSKRTWETISISSKPSVSPPPICFLFPSSFFAHRAPWILCLWQCCSGLHT